MELTLTRQKKPTAVAGLDIEAGSIAATEVEINGAIQVKGSAIASLPPDVFHDGEVVNPDALADSLKALFGTYKISKRVRIGIGNQQVIVRTVRLPLIEDAKEMEAAVRFQAQEQIPMPLDQAVLEHQVVGGVPAEEGSAPKVDVVVVAARREMIASFLEPVRRAGLEPIGIDLSAFAMIRALADAGVTTEVEPGEKPTEALLYCNLGDATNLAVARGRSCLFTRVSHVGLEEISAQLGAARGLTPEHSFQWLSFVGLGRPLETIEGDPETVAEARRVLEEGLATLLDELRLSLDYYGAQEGAVPVRAIALSGAGSAIPGLAQEMEQRLGIPIQIVRPPALSGYEDAAAARLALSYGLALES
jgi:type IV pilus assembly protein PilM